MGLKKDQDIKSGYDVCRIRQAHEKRQDPQGLPALPRTVLLLAAVPVQPAEHRRHYIADPKHGSPSLSDFPRRGLSFVPTSRAALAFLYNVCPAR